MTSVGSPAAAPSTVERAFQLWIAAIVVYVISALVAVLLPPSAEDYAEYFQKLGIPPEVGAQAVAQQSSVGAIIGLVLSVLFGALFAWFGLKMRAGANWARIVNVVLSALGVLSVVVALGASAPRAGGVFGLILQIITALLLLGVIWFAFQRPSNEYFGARR